METMCEQTIKPGNPTEGERLGTVDLLVLTSADQLLLKLNIYLVITKQAT